MRNGLYFASINGLYFASIITFFRHPQGTHRMIPLLMMFVPLSEHQASLSNTFQPYHCRHPTDAQVHLSPKKNDKKKILC